MATEVIYKGNTLGTINGGEYLTLHVNGKTLLDDIRVNVTADGGTCSGNHIIEVTELPTENIDSNALYLCDGAYYKCANELVDVIDRGTSYAEVFSANNVDYSFNTLPTKPTNGILVSTFPPFHFYYIEDEDDVFLYAADAGWFTFTDDNGTPYLGTITDKSEATSTEGYYAVMNRCWEKYFTGTQVIETDTLPTENIDTTATYLIDGVYYKYLTNFKDVIYVNSSKEITSHGEYFGSLGFAISFNVIPTKTTEGVLVSAGEVLHYYYITDENALYTYTQDGWQQKELVAIISDESEVSSTYNTAAGFYVVGPFGWVKYTQTSWLKNGAWTEI